MAQDTVCGMLKDGQDTSCLSPSKRYYQQAVVINKSDIDEYEVTKTDTTTPSAPCAHHVTFTLKAGKTGFMFKGSEAGSTYKGYVDKSRNELFGLPQYIHHAQILIAGADEETKCKIDSMDRGSFVIAYQFKDGTVEIYGIENGLTTDDYTLDLQENGGGQALILSSLESAPENDLPLIYKSAVSGGETADFDELFAAPTP